MRNHAVAAGVKELQKYREYDSAGAVVEVVHFLKPAITASLPAAPPEGSFGYDLTLNKLVVWTGAAYEAVTSV